MPQHLLLIATGNIRNVDLETILLANAPAMEHAFVQGRFVELTRSTLLVHA